MKKLLISLIAVSLLSAQQQVPVIKVTSRLVQVSVVVHDKKGKPVTGLTKDDFVLYDQEQEQKIRLFAEENKRPPARPPQALPAGTVANRVWTPEGSTAQAAAPPNSLTVILLDGLNTRFMDRNSTKLGLVKFLSEIQPGDQVALYTLNNGLKVLHDFTTDTASLLRSIQQFKAGASWQLDNSTPTDSNTGNSALDDFLAGNDERVTAFYQQRKMATTYVALITIAHHLSGLPGRKNLVWLTGGFPLFVGRNADGTMGSNYHSFSDEMKATARVLNSSGIAIYPVDARGLGGAFDSMPSSQASAGAANLDPKQFRAPGSSRADMLARSNILDTQIFMRDIADRTGGRAFVNTNDFGGAIRAAVADAESTYTLAYQPTHNEWNGSYRTLKIKLKQQGLEARYRLGYYAFPEDPSDSKTREKSMIAAANSPLGAAGVSLVAKVVTPPAGDPPASTVRLVVETPSLTFTTNEKNQQAADFDVLMVVYDQKSEVLYQLSKANHLALTQQQYETFQKNGIGMTMGLSTPPGSYRIRAVVRDMADGTIGTVDIPLSK